MNGRLLLSSGCALRIHTSVPNLCGHLSGSLVFSNRFALFYLVTEGERSLLTAMLVVGYTVNLNINLVSK